MISKNQIKQINALKLKKQREEKGLFIAEGVKVVEEMLNAVVTVNEVFATAVFLSKNSKLLNSKRIKYNEVTAEELKRISLLSTPNEVLAVCRIPRFEIKLEILIPKLNLVLDDIKDPGNLGTIIRIADWFGIEHIICSPQTVDAFNPKVVQATMGSIARVKLLYTDLHLFFEQLKTVTNKLGDINLPVYGALLQGDSIYRQQLSDNGFIIIGNEAKGISDTVMPFVTNKIKIPSFSTGSETAESLNAATATSIICSEFRRSGSVN